MKSNFKRAFNQLKAIGAPVIEGGWNGEDDTFRISAEDNSNRIWASYWDQSYGQFGISKDIVQILEDNDIWPEWINPGVIGVFS